MMEQTLGCFASLSLSKLLLVRSAGKDRTSFMDAAPKRQYSARSPNIGDNGFLPSLKRRESSVIFLKEVIKNGEIIEKYLNDKPLPSYLIYGRTRYNRPIHVVIGVGADMIAIITVYEPKEEKMRLKTCPECGGKMESKKTKFMTEVNGVLIVIEDISADICSECGAEYLPAEVDEYVEGVVEEVMGSKSNVEPRKEEVFRVAEG